MSEQIDGLSVTVTTPNSGGQGHYFKGEIESDTWHLAELVEIKSGVSNYKGKESPAWIWVYELQDKKFGVKDDEGKLHKANVIEKTSQKVTGQPRVSNAYKRYAQLTGVELKSGENVSLKNLFGTVCKIMVKNVPGDGDIIYHNIEKITIKGIEGTVESISEEMQKETDKNVEDAESKKVPVKKEKSTTETTEVSDDIFDGLDLD